MNEAYRDLTFEELLMVNGGRARHSRKSVSAGGQDSQTQNSDNDKNDSHTVVGEDTLTKIVKGKNPDLKGEALAKEVDRVAAQNNLKDKNLIKVGEKLDLGKGNSREDKTKENSTNAPNRNRGKTETEENSSKIVKESNREDKTEESFPRTSSEGKEKRSEAGSLTTTNKSNSNDINKTKQTAASANNKPEPTKNNLLGALTNGVNYIGSEWNKFKNNVGKVRDKIQSDLDTLKNNIGNAWNNAANTVKNGLRQLADKVGNDLNQVKNSWHNLWNKEEYKNKLNPETSVKPKAEPAYFKQGQFDDVMVDGKPLFTKEFADHACNVTSLLNEFSEEYTKQTGEKLDFTEAAIFTKTLVTTESTPGNIIQDSDELNWHARVIDDVRYLNALSEHFNIGTADGKKWHHDYQKDRLSGYQPNAGEHLIYYNGYHFSNNTNSGSQIFEVWHGEIIDFTNENHKFFYGSRTTPADVTQTRRYVFK
ncbi:hypothetical protein [Treponema pedis]|uniref:LysM domain-containing protein n=1 Tax=Treponema pedis TaxID=409322 RepID=A0A7S6WMD8_9SPIR|nr:hypothetical protein [Treponema pedis]QOW59790.1 hypothetical protein IFE08_07865 [Treponema pedis]